MIWLSIVIGALSSAGILASEYLCPPSDSIRVYENAWKTGDSLAYSRLVYCYTVCDSGVEAHAKLQQLMKGRFAAGNIGAGVTILSGKFTKAVGSVCKETYSMRKDIRKRQGELKSVSLSVLNEMDSLCGQWGAR